MKKTFFIIILIVLLGLVYSLVNQIYNALQAGSRLDQTVEELAQIQKKNRELKDELLEVSSPHFIEQQARDKLNFARPNEVVLIIPQQDVGKLIDSYKEATPESIPNWQGWLKLFIK